MASETIIIKMPSPTTMVTTHLSVARLWDDGGAMLGNVLYDLVDVMLGHVQNDRVFTEDEIIDLVSVQSGDAIVETAFSNWEDFEYTQDEIGKKAWKTVEVYSEVMRVIYRHWGTHLRNLINQLYQTYGEFEVDDLDVSGDQGNPFTFEGPSVEIKFTIIY